MIFDDDSFRRQREEMVRDQIEKRGVLDAGVLSVMRQIPRHVFAPAECLEYAYEDHPLPVGPEETISQPFIVAYMLEKLELHSDDRVLEIGTGSGYQTAILSSLVKEVFSVEIDGDLSRKASLHLEEMGCSNVHLLVGDGQKGWSGYAPFSKIIVTAACTSVPEDLIRQLAEGGLMILPLGSYPQYLVLIGKTGGATKKATLCAVSFVRIRDRV